MQAVFIKRALTSLLENALKHRRCIFITGPLGAGKTSLLKTLYPKEVTGNFLPPNLIP